MFNDLNGDGLRDEDEPGLAGWQITQGCGDIAWIITTDANGYAAGTTTVADDCFSLQRQFGWLPTRNGVYLKFDPATLNGEPLMFGMHDFGRNVMELHGEAIDGGLPLVQGEPGVADPYASCGHFFSDAANPTLVRGVVIVESGSTRSGCPRAGDAIVPAISVMLSAGPPLTFAPGSSADITWVIDGDSMRFYEPNVTDAWVLDASSGQVIKGCGVVRPVPGARLITPDLERVFVLSAEVRPDCGAPGRQVRLVRGNQLLDPILNWRAGNIDQAPELTVASLENVTPPNTGDGAPAARASRVPVAIAVVLTVTAAVALRVGVLLRRR